MLVVGGIGAELYDPETGHWSSTGNLITPRYGHVAVRLANGKVLVAGGNRTNSVSFNDRVLASAEIYDPATGAWQSAGDLSVPREGHTANLLADGTVLVIGGRNYPEAGWVRHSSAEIYDPATGAWSSAGTMRSPHFRHASTLLANGTVLVIGGVGGGREAELFDLATRTWTATGNLTTARASSASWYGPRATVLPDGKVLVSGGDQSGPNSWGVYPAIDTAELYDPVTGQWSATGGMTERRAAHTQTLLPDGKVLVAGGHRGDAGSWPGNGKVYDPNHDAFITVLDTAELYDPVYRTMERDRQHECVPVWARSNIAREWESAGGWGLGLRRQS